MGGGGTIIIGDKDIVTQVEDHIGLVADFRRGRAASIIALYRKEETAITGEDQQYLLRCCADIVDNR